MGILAVPPVIEYCETSFFDIKRGNPSDFWLLKEKTIQFSGHLSAARVVAKHTGFARGRGSLEFPLMVGSGYKKLPFI